MNRHIPEENLETRVVHPRRRESAESDANMLKTLYHICLAKNNGKTHAERMENYFGPQASGYDTFRNRFLHGRRRLYESLPCPAGGVWLDVGGGTGQCLEFLNSRRQGLKKIYLLDISPSLLEIARSRAARLGWKNLECVHADALSFVPPEGKVDVITFSYSLTMIPRWFEVIDRLRSFASPGAWVGVVDFYQAEKRPYSSEYPAQGLTSRILWQLFFQGDDVMLDRNHLPYLEHAFEKQDVFFGRTKIPYLPIRPLYYGFIGRHIPLSVR
jgi:S-adenosylmethionine-diacylgycerolhomoserine-N-methlytransferase